MAPRLNGSGMRDIVICGAGSAGCVLALRLSEDPQNRVWLIEAGPDYATPADAPHDIAYAADMGSLDHDWGYHVADQGAPRTSANGVGADDPSQALAEHVPAFRGKVVGGSGAVNGANALVPRPEDLDGWPAGPEGGWTWGEFQEVLDSFISDASAPLEYARMPIRNKTTGELSDFARGFVDACASLGHHRSDNLNAPPWDGAGSIPQNQVDGIRFSPAFSHLKWARARPNLTVLSDTVVDRVIFDAGRARGVLLADGTQLAADEVVLSAGAVGSPTILLRSGVGPKGELERLGVPSQVVLEGVGKNLWDHPMVYPTWARSSRAGANEDVPLEVMLISSSGVAGSSGRADLHFLPLVTPQQIVCCIGLVQPRSVGSVRISSLDPLEAPEIRLNFFEDAADLDALAAGVSLARSLFSSSPLRDFVGEELFPGPGVAEEDIRQTLLESPTESYCHLVGTCKMGPEEDQDAVVDEWGRVHGVEGLSVIDASVFPVIPSVPTHLMTIGVAERCAARLASTLKVPT